MALKGKPIAIGATDTTIYTCPATTEASIHGLVFANNTAGAVTITLKVYIQSTATTTTVATGLSVAANSTYTWPKPVDVNAGDYIVAVASTGSAVVCLYSVYEGAAVAAAVGFTPRGAWGSGSTYAVNDVVSLSGSSYLAIQASTNQNPATQTAYWLLLASIGATGASGTNGTNGTGDVNGPASSVDSELALFNSTTGKLIKRASLTGLVKSTSGVASAATAGTDYGAPATASTWSASQRGTVTAANTASFDMNVTNNFSCTPTATATLTFTNITAGQSGYILLVNGSNYTIAAAATTKVATGVLTALSATGTYLVSYFSNGTNVYLTASGALA